MLWLISIVALPEFITQKATCFLCNVTQDFLATLRLLRPLRPLRPCCRRERIALPGLHGQQPGEFDHRHRKCAFSNTPKLEIATKHQVIT